MGTSLQILKTCKCIFNVVGSTRADGRRVESTRVAAIEALFSSINPAISQSDSLNKHLAKAIELASSISPQPPSVRRAIFENLAKIFDRIQQQGKGGDVDFDAVNLKSILLGVDEIESLRLLKANAILAIRKSSPKLFSNISVEIDRLKVDETSSAVRDRLQ